MQPALQTSVDDWARVLATLPAIPLHTTHNKSGSVYARTIFIPAGGSLVGATHKTDHINIVLGDITVTTDTGPVRITGYHILEAKAGHKRAGSAHADTEWTTICHTTKSTLSEIEDELVVEASDLLTRKPSLEAANTILLGS